MLLLVSRKNLQNQPTWIPYKDSALTSVTMRQVTAARAACNAQGIPLKTAFLFPARKRGRASYKKRSADFAMNPKRHMSTESFVKLVRIALMECCGLSSDQASKFRNHSLRVGGLNYCRSVLGLGPEERQLLGGWASRSSSLQYIRRSPAEMLKILRC